MNNFYWQKARTYPDGMRRWKLIHEPCSQLVFDGGHAGRRVDRAYFYDAANKSARAHECEETTEKHDEQ